MQEFYMLVGAPASGKSTFVKDFLATRKDQKFTVISSDDIIMDWGRILDPNINYSDAFAVANYKEVQKELNERLNSAIANLENIIWDQTNLTSKSRKGRVSRIPKIYRKTAVVFELEHDELFRRLEHRAQQEGKHIPKKVVTDMLNTYEKPVVSEGFDKIIFV